MSYQQDFLTALTCTAQLGLPLPKEPGPNVARVLSDSFMTQLMPRLISEAGIESVGDMFSKCNMVSEHILPIVERETKMRAYLTVGDVRWNGQQVHERWMDFDYARQLREAGLFSCADIRHHAWITLESYEVLDLTLSLSLEEQRRLNEGAAEDGITFAPIYGDADQQKSGVTFHPVLVGSAFYYEGDPSYDRAIQRYKARARSVARLDAV